MKRDKTSRHASAVNPALHLTWAKTLDRSQIRNKWLLPIVGQSVCAGETLTGAQLTALAETYLEMFLPFFTDQREGSINPQVQLQFSPKMKQKLGLAYLFEHKIRLNLSYFREDPSLLPYTLFHEMTHIWLYDCMFDPGHTQRFYNKMAEFQITGLSIDPDVYVHRRIASEGKFVYICPNCSNRWYMRERLKHAIYCGHCYDREGVEHFARRLKQDTGRPTGDIDSAA